MKKVTCYQLPLLVLLCLISISGFSQHDSSKTYVVIKHDGNEFVGRILREDAREVLILTKETGEVIIPKHEIRTIKQLDPGELSSQGTYLPPETFSTRYFITTNGLPIEKGDNYIQWNLFGPDFQFGLGKNFGAGIMTSWVGVPLIGNMKYTINLDEKVNLGIGTLLGTGSWAIPEFKMALPFAALTFGDRRANINFAGGYGYISDERGSSGRILCSVAGMAKIGRKVSFIFDSFIMLEGPSVRETRTGYGYNATTQQYEQYSYYAYRRRPGMAIIIPGIRFQMSDEKAFQFGFGGLIYDSEVVPVPLPMVQWYRKI